MLQYGYRSNAPILRSARAPDGVDLVEYSPIIDRPKIRWPGEARLALWICPNILYYEYVAQPNQWLEMWTRMPQPDVLAYGRQDYGNRVGFWRMLEVLDRRRIRCTAVVNAEALRRFPEIRDAAVERDWRYLGHGINNSRFTYGFDYDAERTYYAEMRDTIEALTGVRMSGTGGPGPQASTEATPDVLAELGFLYHSDWFHDDQPFPLRVRSGRLISLPYSIELNDAPFLGTAFEGEHFLDAVRRQFDRLYAEGEESGRVMCISIHPALIGQPQRVRFLDEALEYIGSFPGVWQATGDEIAAHYVANCYDEMAAHLASAAKAKP
jgi:peptidoglycan/xylan/chitin deacetylase (PgdA/CDA1 family)